MDHRRRRRRRPWAAHRVASSIQWRRFRYFGDGFIVNLFLRSPRRAGSQTDAAKDTRNPKGVLKFNF